MGKSFVSATLHRSFILSNRVAWHVDWLSWRHNWRPFLSNIVNHPPLWCAYQTGFGILANLLGMFWGFKTKSNWRTIAQKWADCWFVWIKHNKTADTKQLVSHPWTYDIHDSNFLETFVLKLSQSQGSVIFHLRYSTENLCIHDAFELSKIHPCWAKIIPDQCPVVTVAPAQHSTALRCILFSFFLCHGSLSENPQRTFWWHFSFGLFLGWSGLRSSTVFVSSTVQQRVGNIPTKNTTSNLFQKKQRGETKKHVIFLIFVSSKKVFSALKSHHRLFVSPPAAPCSRGSRASHAGAEPPSQRWSPKGSQQSQKKQLVDVTS